MSLLSAAVALALGGLAADAGAVALGRLNVMSALGQPLRAEIEITDLAPGDADGLRVSIASAEAFNAAGVPYNAVLSDVRVGVTKRPDGRYVVRLTSNKSLSEPFVDLLLEANWSSGRIVRDYTVLLDPPGSRLAQAPVAPVAPQISPAERAAAVRRERPPAVTVAPAPAPAPVTAAAPAAPAAPAAGGNQRAGTVAGGEQIRVQPGDTAGKIASTYKPADVSLDQMLVALLRANPDAFIGGNVNRVKAGAVIQVPSAAQAEAIPAPEAHRTVSAQSADFGDYRRRLADNAPTSRVPEADRQASGKLQANVEDRNASSASPDKLKISQGIAPGRPTDEQIAQSRQTQAANDRVAELSKNISDLNKLQAASGASAAAPAGVPAVAAAAGAAAPATAAPAASAAPAAAPAATAPTPPAAAAAAGAAPATPAAATPPAAASSTAASAPAAASATAAAAPGAAGTAPATPAATPATPAPEAAAKPPAPPKPKVAPPPPPPPPSFFSELLDNPLMLGLAALIVAAIAFLLYRVLGRKRQDAGDSVFIESRIPKDSFFGASGGESVDTKNRSSTGMSSLSYSPSQLDAGDVDPVAEADVYLAYGRDLQAEEILREALRVNPERSAIHLKLLEIHAKRRDLRGYEALAAEVHKLTGGTGVEWNRVVEMGKELDPGNPLYETGKGNVTAAEAAAFAGTLAAASAAGAHAAPHPVAPVAPAAPIAVAPAPFEPLAAAAPPAFVPSVAPLDFDLDLTRPASLPDTLPGPVSASLPLTPAAQDISFASTEHGAPRVVASTTAAPALNGNMAASPAAARLDLENDFDTAPGALDAITGPGPIDEERTQPAPLTGGLQQDSGFIEFDMSSLAGLGARPTSDTERGRLEPLDDGGENPHAIKLSLARELKALGDVEGARSLVEEVAAESAGDIKAEAKQLLGQLR